jgi:hypothetical protein
VELRQFVVCTELLSDPSLDSTSNASSTEENVIIRIFAADKATLLPAVEVAWRAGMTVGWLVDIVQQSSSFMIAYL